MPQSLSAAYLHLVFSTKERRPFLRDVPLRTRLHAFLAETSTRLDCPALIVGGVTDHVHLLARFGRTLTQSEWVKELKRASNTFLKQNASDLSSFEWQSGYATFSVSYSNIEHVKTYIATQEEHHRVTDYKTELIALLTKHQLTWDDRYLWD